MTSENQPFLTFYEDIGFAPTRQSPSSSDAHLARRSFLYRSLGVPDIAVRGSSVLEFGPGSGENSSVILAQGPKSYTFVDGSKAVLDNLQNRLREPVKFGGGLSSEINFILSDILNFNEDSLYDLVICEGVLPMQMNPKEMALHVMQFVRPGGCVIFTSFDSVSAFSEIARRFIASLTFSELKYSSGLVGQLVDFFAPDFASLPGMSRRPEDWVIDSIINPWIGEFFSLQDAHEVSSNGFALLGTSPRIIQDWRWYKDPSTLTENATLKLAISSYRRNIHSLLDARVTGPSLLDDKANEKLMDITSSIATRVRGHISMNLPYEPAEFGADVQRMIETTGHLHEYTIASLNSLTKWAMSGQTSDLTQFRALWGRGQQYVSLVRLR